MFFDLSLTPETDWDRISCLEGLKYQSLSHGRLNEGKLDGDLKTWFEKDLAIAPTTGADPEAPIGGLRLLIIPIDDVDGHPLTLPIAEPDLVQLRQHMSFPSGSMFKVVTYDTRAYKFSINASINSSGETKTGFVFKLPMQFDDAYCLILNHNVVTNVNHGLILVKGPPGILTPVPLRQLLEESQAHCDKAILLPLLLLEWEIKGMEETHSTTWDKLDALEEQTGQHEYKDWPRGDPLAIDFIATTGGLNFCYKMSAREKSHASCLNIILKNIIAWHNDLGGYEESPEIAERLAMAGELLTIKHLDLEYDEKRINMLMQVVCQYMAQKDAKINIALAENSAAMTKASKEDSAAMRAIALETKRDSSAMKTIATLGMLFLPGTFVAAIFAMPVFEWDVNGAPVMKNGFRYYWAVTMPLTLLVLACWALAVLLPWRRWLAKIGLSKASDGQDIEVGSI